MSDVAGTPADFEGLLEYLKSVRGFDFTSYKRTTLSRRIEKRMQAVGVATYDAYQDYLEVHPEEFQGLFNTILINVTAFFRDRDAWDYVAETVIPTILGGKEGNGGIRVWVAGCASGEEACTLAMLFAEALGIDGFRNRVKIYATDLDEEALACSRTASYSERDLEAVPEELRTKYFERTGEHFVFDRDLRRSIIFGRHDLLQDAPISRVDFLLCRNTLMYFNAEAQDRIVQRFHFALNEDGFLFLGKAETMLAHNDLFTTVELRHHIFAKLPRGRIRDRGFMFSTSANDGGRVEMHGLRLRDAAFEANPTALVVLDPNGLLTLANERARTLFGLTMRDLGTPIQDLELSFRPVELRSGIETAHRQRRPVRHTEVNWISPGGEGLTFDITITALKNETALILGTSILFQDVTVLKRTQSELQNFRQELETAYEEVQSTNEELQTTNEELQSTVEELETTNEELQSTNEETETMNEELQSANEELETMNEELRQRSNELNRANAFMESVLASLRDGVIVLDNELQIMAWNYQSEDLWGLRADEVLGKHLLNLDIGLPVEQFRTVIRTCIATEQAQQAKVEAVNRRGRRVTCTVDFSPLRGTFQNSQGTIILTTCVDA